MNGTQITDFITHLNKTHGIFIFISGLASRKNNDRIFLLIYFVVKKKKNKTAIHGLLHKHLSANLTFLYFVVSAPIKAILCISQFVFFSRSKDRLGFTILCEKMKRNHIFNRSCLYHVKHIYQYVW